MRVDDTAWSEECIVATETSIEEKLAACPPRLREIIEEFRMAAPQERLEYLIEFSESLPDLPEHLLARRDQMEQVHECQTPVFLHTERRNGHLRFYFDVPRESPTVRGYAAILAEGLNGADPEQVLAIPDDVHMLLGLHEAISPLRLRGLHALIRYVKRQVMNLTDHVSHS